MASFLESVKGGERVWPVLYVFERSRLVVQTLTKRGI